MVRDGDRRRFVVDERPGDLPPWPPIGEVEKMPLRVHFKRPVGWGETIRVHYWELVPVHPGRYGPHPASLRYTGAIALERTATLAVIGVNSAGESGQARIFHYTIDPNADLERPVIASSHVGGTYGEPIQVVFTVRDNRPAPITAYFTLDGSEPDASAPVYATGSAVDGLAGPAVPVEATTTVRFLVVDGAGNETRRSFYFNIGPTLATGDFREETIFLLTARFYDGDPSNNYLVVVDFQVIRCLPESRRTSHKATKRDQDERETTMVSAPAMTIAPVSYTHLTLPTKRIV